LQKVEDVKEILFTMETGEICKKAEKVKELLGNMEIGEICK
jgi:hypothetical protein